MQDATECERLTKEPTTIGTRDRTDVAAKFYLKTRIIGVRLNFRVAGPVASVKNNVNKQQLATWEHLNGEKKLGRDKCLFVSVVNYCADLPKVERSFLLIERSNKVCAYCLR